eukprot:6549942-Prymnesium_polylepis.1
MATTTTTSDIKYNNKTRANFKNWQRLFLRTLDKHSNKLLYIVLNGSMDVNYRAKLIVTLRSSEPTKYADDVPGKAALKKALDKELLQLNQTAFYITLPPHVNVCIMACYTRVYL